MGNSATHKSLVDESLFKQDDEGIWYKLHPKKGWLISMMPKASGFYQKLIPLKKEKPNKYKHTIQGDGEYTTDVDVYDVLRAWNITDPAHAHGLKKILQPGTRGAKDLEQDLEEGIKSLQMYLAHVGQST